LYEIDRSPAPIIKKAERGGLRIETGVLSLGFEELVDLFGQDEIALCQAVDFVRPGRDRLFPKCGRPT